MELQFTLCSKDDLRLLRTISEQTFITAFEKDNDPVDFQKYIEKAFSFEKIKEEWSNVNSSFYFVYKMEKLIGYFKLNVADAQSDVKLEDSIELERIYVLSNFQGEGYGEKLLNHVKKLSSQKNKTMLWLGVWEHNKRAIAFYKRQGFQKFATHPYFIGSDEQTDWLMRFNLSNL